MKALLMPDARELVVCSRCDCLKLPAPSRQRWLLPSSDMTHCGERQILQNPKQTRALAIFLHRHLSNSSLPPNCPCRRSLSFPAHFSISPVYIRICNCTSVPTMGPKKESTAISVRPDALKGTSVVVTGEIEGQTRKSAELILGKAGAAVEASLNKKVQLLVVGAKAGQNKLDKAEKMGIDVRDWDDVIEEIKGEGGAAEPEPEDDEDDEDDEEEEEVEEVSPHIVVPLYLPWRLRFIALPERRVHSTRPHREFL
ncbi:hypothetical protein BDV96DRAFT_35491 [Lophiotrema nucula]|uniref:BRCT domain-containing protein n=1 Tax=Lophiotrema nucula TaxID=690887 RepID=A0A6A5ZD00_9PLEO|nr:hypothetical protein BDV96DRAFT_35491 [Lophiotrema nucula]